MLWHTWIYRQPATGSFSCMLWHKKSFCPSKGTKAKYNSNIYFYHFCGTTQFVISCDHSFMYYHTHLFDNGRESRQHLLPSSGFKLPSQVHSVKTLITAIPPPAALWEQISLLTPLVHRFYYFTTL